MFFDYSVGGGVYGGCFWIIVGVCGGYSSRGCFWIIVGECVWGGYVFVFGLKGVGGGEMYMFSFLG